MIALITPTGDRPKQFDFMYYCMMKQTYRGEILWVQVDDGKEKVIDKYESTRENIREVKLYNNYECEGVKSQKRNILTAVDYLLKKRVYNKIKRVFIIEDDDYYRKDYLERSMYLYNMTGAKYIAYRYLCYYNLTQESYRYIDNVHYGALYNINFDKTLLETLKHVCSDEKTGYIDIEFAKRIPQQNKFIFEDTDVKNFIAIGLKAWGTGREGIGMGHKTTRYFLKDVNRIALKQFIKDEETYKKLINDNN